MTSKQYVILDCDPGIDDAVALMLAAASPELQLLAVTCVAGNRPVHITAANARKILDLVGAASVPVYAGSSRPLAHPNPRCNEVHGLDGLGGVILAPGQAIEPEHAVDKIVRTLMERPVGTVTLVAIGPLTNFALAEIKVPGILRRAATFAIMGGAAFCPGNITPAAEFNFYADPVAAHVVSTATANPIVFGLDVTSQVVMSREWIDSISRLGTRSGIAMGQMLNAYANLDPLLHDACPVAYLLDHTLFAGRPCALEVDWSQGANEGKTIVKLAAISDSPFVPNAKIITEVEQTRLLDLVLSRLSNLP